MENIQKLTTFEHLEDNEKTYRSHLCRTLQIGGGMILTGLKTIIHGIYPDVFKSSATDKVIELNKELQFEIECKVKKAC